MKKILLLGSNGQLGSDIFKVLSNSYNITPKTHRELDITNHSNVYTELNHMKPDIVINTAAYHKVDEIEDNPQKAFLVNSIAQKNLATVCEKIGSTIVFLSTDYIFGLESNRKNPYKENDIPGPVNIYGVSKVSGEMLTRTYSSKYFIIRTCGLYGINNSKEKGLNFIERMIQLSKTKKIIEVVSDQILSPTYTKNFATNLSLLLKTQKYGTYHMVSEESCSWWEFANEIFKYLNIKVKCKKVNSDFFKNKAKRPNYSVLENYHLNKLKINHMKNWKNNLTDYLLEKKYL